MRSHTIDGSDRRFPIDARRVARAEPIYRACRCPRTPARASAWRTARQRAPLRRSHRGVVDWPVEGSLGPAGIRPSRSSDLPVLNVTRDGPPAAVAKPIESRPGRPLRALRTRVPRLLGGVSAPRISVIAGASARARDGSTADRVDPADRVRPASTATPIYAASEGEIAAFRRRVGLPFKGGALLDA